MNEVREFLVKLFKPGDKVVIAVSGGPDSMALLHLLWALKEKCQIELVCAHVHHNMRKESDEEKRFLESYCKEHQILFEFYKIEHYEKDNFHQEARTLRYRFFEEIVKKHHANYLFTAHHGDDLMETILMRLVRGSTLYGYHGFSKVTDHTFYSLVRPLITVTREEIMEYLNEYEIPYVIDGSNLKDDYTRNRYRKYVLPTLKKENRQVHHKFYQFSQMLEESDQVIQMVVDQKLKEVYVNQRLHLNLFHKESSYLQKRILQSILVSVYQEQLNMMEEKHIVEMMKFLSCTKANASMSLPNHVFLVKEYEEAYFTSTIEKKEYCDCFHGKLVLPNGFMIEQVEESEKDDNFTCRLDTSEISLPLTIRTRKVGDRMEVKGLKGTKKINDIFTNEKIPKGLRDEWPIVTDANGIIVWLPGLKKTKFDRTKDRKYDIILRYSLKKEGLNE